MYVRSALNQTFAVVTLFVVALIGAAAMSPAAAATPGDLAWMQSWSPGGAFEDYGRMELVRAPGGDLVVGAQGDHDSAQPPFVTRTLVARYAPSGARRWALVLPATAERVAFAGVAVDRQGNAVVTSHQLPAKWVTTKLNSSGKRVWTKVRTSAKALTVTAAGEVAVDSRGNAYVVGTLARASTGNDVALWKYSPSGALKWTRYLSGFAASDDRGVALGVDGSGRVYVTGTVGGFFSGTDIVVACFTGAGTQVWTRTWGGDALGSDWPTDLAVSGAGVAVACISYGADGHARGVILTASLNLAEGVVLSEQVTSLSGKDLWWRSVAINAVGDIAVGGSAYEGPEISFAYARFRLTAPDTVSYFKSPASNAECSDVWLTADSTVLAAGVWLSGPLELDLCVLSDPTAGENWRSILVTSNWQEGRAILATNAAVYVAGRGGSSLALWKYER